MCQLFQVRRFVISILLNVRMSSGESRVLLNASPAAAGCLVLPTRPLVS